MTTYTFTPEIVTDEDQITPDVVPSSSDVEYPCRVCGRESGPYSGRGRKPVLCPDHKRAQVKSAPKVRGSDASLAAKASEALVQLNAVIGMGMMVTGFHKSGKAIFDGNDGFREQAYNALLTDPDLCRQILRAGGTSAKFSLIIAYGMFGASVAPTVVLEVREKRAEKEDE